MSFATSLPQSVSASASEAAKIGLTLALQQVSALSTLPADASFPLEDFISLWHNNAEKPLLCSPIHSIEALDVVDQSNGLRQQTMGLFGHRFVIASALVRSPTEPDSGPEPIYIRVDLWATGQTIRIHHTWEKLIDEKTSLVMKLASSHGATAPSLDAFVSLLDEIKKRTLSYNVTLSNCLSFTEQIMFVAGRKYADHWRSPSGGIFPQPLRDYIDGRMDEVDAGVAVGVPEGLLRGTAQVGMRVVKGIQSFLTWSKPREQQVRWPGEIISEILNAWEPHKPVEV